MAPAMGGGTGEMESGTGVDNTLMQRYRFVHQQHTTSAAEPFDGYYSATTGADGKVSCEDVPAGTYWVFASAYKHLTCNAEFTAAEDTTPSGASVAVLSHAFWTAELGSRDVLGESIQIDNIVCTIIGVAPAGFTGVADGEAPLAYLPITTFGAHQPGG